MCIKPALSDANTYLDNWNVCGKVKGIFGYSELRRSLCQTFNVSAMLYLINTK